MGESHFGQIHGKDGVIFQAREEVLFDNRPPRVEEHQRSSCPSWFNASSPCCALLLVSLISLIGCLVFFFAIAMPMVWREIDESCSDSVCPAPPLPLPRPRNMDEVWIEINLLKTRLSTLETDVKSWTNQVLQDQYLNLTRQMSAEILALDTRHSVRLANTNQTLTSMVANNKAYFKTEQINLKYTIQDHYKELQSEIRNLNLTIQYPGSVAGGGRRPPVGSDNDKIINILTRMAKLEASATGSGSVIFTVNGFKNELHTHLSKSVPRFVKIEQDIQVLFGKFGRY